MSLPDRLAFVLPDFTRITWTSDRARQVWEPRLRRISHAWSEVEWLSVAHGVRRCSIARMSDDRFHASAARWAEHGVSALGLAREAAGRSPYSSTAPAAPVPGQPSVLCVGLAAYTDLAPLREAWNAHDPERLGELLGYPVCCRRFFRRIWVEEASVDPTWHMAVNSDGSERHANRITVWGPPLANILCRWIGVRAVPHLPCSATCPPTVALAEGLCDVAASEGFADELRWMREILSWPVEWSALHGVAEIRTPILKVSARTDATATRYEVRRNGSSYPEEGATGLRFPYRSSSRATTPQPFAFRPSAPSWQHTDNGFSTRASMDRAHELVGDVAAQVLAGSGGPVLDLGCGNAMLLKRIVARAGSHVIPFGLDLQRQHIEHARVVLPENAANFQVGDMFADDLEWKQRRYRLVLISANRLLEVSETKAREFTDCLLTLCDHLLAYRYPSPSPADLDALADRCGLRVEVRTPHAIVANGLRDDEQPVDHIAR